MLVFIMTIVCMVCIVCIPGGAPCQAGLDESVSMLVFIVLAGRWHQYWPSGLCYNMLIVFVTLTCFVCVCMYTKRGPMLGGA